MDYEVFIPARMREAFDATGSAREAVVTAIGRTGRLVTSAALIPMLSSVAMTATPPTDVKILATGRAAGILVDATIVRCLLVLALAGLSGVTTGGYPPGWPGFRGSSRRRCSPRWDPPPATNATGQHRRTTACRLATVPSDDRESGAAAH
jgi:MMPL family